MLIPPEAVQRRCDSEWSRPRGSRRLVVAFSCRQAASHVAREGQAIGVDMSSAGAGGVVTTESGSLRGLSDPGWIAGQPDG
jgi:hypothetical protein